MFVSHVSNRSGQIQTVLDLDTERQNSSVMFHHGTGSRKLISVLGRWWRVTVDPLRPKTWSDTHDFIRPDSTQFIHNFTSENWDVGGSSFHSWLCGLELKILQEKMSICLFICQQDFIKTTKPICTGLGGGTRPGPGMNPVIFQFLSMKSGVCCSSLALMEVCALPSVILVTWYVSIYIIAVSRWQKKKWRIVVVN